MMEDISLIDSTAFVLSKYILYSVKVFLNAAENLILCGKLKKWSI